MFTTRARRAGLAIWRSMRVRRWRRPGYTSTASPVIVGGCGRSGTTLMRVILDTHPSICCGPESHLFLPHLPAPAKLAQRFGLSQTDVATLLATSATQAEFIDRFFARYAEVRQKPRWAEKTPRNVLHLDYLFEH